MITVYGISNCDTVKAALKAMGEAGIACSYHDFRKDGADEALLARLAGALGYEAMVNRRGTTWRNLPETVKAAFGPAIAIEVMLENVALIKRPIFEKDGEYAVGFAKSDRAHRLAWLSG